MDEGTGQSSQRRPVRVLIRDEEVEHITAHSWMHIASEGADDAEGHGWKFEEAEEGGEDKVFVMSVHREGGGDQSNRGSFLRWIDPNDTEGEGVGRVVLHPAGPEDLEAQGFQVAVLKPDASGSWTVELDGNHA